MRELIIGLLIILALVLFLPFLVRKVEHNLEAFLFVMGLASVIISGEISAHLFKEILTNHLLYMITGAVLVFSILFMALQKQIYVLLEKIQAHIPLNVFVFLMIVILGLGSSIITAIIAALLLVEILYTLPLHREQKITINIIACFSIGLGAVLTPIGEPLATVVVSRLHEDFFFLLRETGIYIIPGVVAMGLLAFFYINRITKKGLLDTSEEKFEKDAETFRDAIIRALKIFLFVFALELLGTGFGLLIDTYVIKLSTHLLYWLNMVSAVLDNATLAAAEISVKMTAQQVQAVLIGLLISGGMLIPGNIPNIISAGKLKISSTEWGKIGVPMGLITMGIYYVILFMI